MRIDLTGHVTVEDGERVLDESALPRQGRVVLACLALHDAPVHRDVLADALWPDGPPATWERTLSGVVSRLRSAFATAGFEGLTIANAFGNYELQHPADLHLDIRDARDEADAAERALSVGDLATAASSATAAAAIARRPFLSGEETDWIDATRTELRAVLVRALDAQAEAAMGTSDAVAAASEALEAEPFRESSHVLIMRAHTAVCNTAQALLAYERCRELLASELGVDPAPETQALHLELLRSEEESIRQTAVSQGLVTLPATQTTFVGRVTDLEAIVGLLTCERLVTLTGPGGMGKTRLAVEASRRSLGSFPDGVRMLDLAGIAASAPLGEHVALALGLKLQGAATAQAIGAALSTQRILLLFDNCEHLLDQVTPFVGELLEAASAPVVLATSRTPLALPDEYVWRVPPLGLPEDEGGRGGVTAADAVALFCERAADVRPGFELTTANAGAVISICRRLDGVPLAIELAAARVGALSAGEIAERLDERFTFTRGPSSSARQRTLRTTIDWSYDLLGPREAETFRRCAAFEGTFVAEDANAVCDRDVGAEIESLAARSLVVPDGSHGSTTYRMLETIKEYARERVAGSEEWDAAVGRHIDRFATVVAGLEALSDQGTFLSSSDAIRPDATAALERALERERLRDAIAIGGVIWRNWHTRGLLTEGRALLERTLAVARASDTAGDIGPVLLGLLTIVFYQADFAYSEALLIEALDLADRRDDDRARAILFANYSSLAQATGNGEAREYAQRAIAAADVSGHEAAAGTAYLVLSVDAAARGDGDEFRSCAENALERYTRAGHHTGVARALILTASARGPASEDWEELMDRALRVSKQIDDKMTEAIVLLQRGVSLDELGRRADALASMQEALRLNRRIGNRRSFLECLEQIACIAAEDDDAMSALMLFSYVQSERLALAIGLSYSDPARLDRLLESAKARAGSGAVRAWREGAELSFEDAFEIGITTTIGVHAGA